jgi:hypothetical protein
VRGNGGRVESLYVRSHSRNPELSGSLQFLSHLSEYAGTDSALPGRVVAVRGDVYDDMMMYDDVEVACEVAVLR